ncbi:BON domain-containing protein [Ramlibacter sp.]|uniref:BON domain-containing protein n=1 Tax=Ramlibacter sp. TaxID=1917967 RepID=UPI002CD4899C|nr:BON domain-containing protein [Ramlibacter sp.]HWI83061.1 BON domain-containing protein [Ramlibacter sp.]
MHPMLNILTSFAAGAAAMYWLDSAVSRRHAGGLFVSESRLGDQVQAQIGKLVSHPDAIKVSVDGGLVRVSGLVLASELDRLLSQLTHLPGVHKVHNALSPVQDAARFEEMRAGQLQGEFGAGGA